MSQGAFTFTKIVVGDLDKTLEFYTKVCGLKEENRISGAFSGRRLTEIILSGGGPATLILIRYHDEPAPAAGEAVMGFYTSDIDAFLQRAVDAGGKITTPVQSLPDAGLKFAFVTDPEGHVVEALQRV